MVNKTDYDENIANDVKNFAREIQGRKKVEFHTGEYDTWKMNIINNKRRAGIILTQEERDFLAAIEEIPPDLMS